MQRGNRLSAIRTRPLDLLRPALAGVLGVFLPAAIYDGPLDGFALPLFLAIGYSGIRLGWVIFGPARLMQAWFMLSVYVLLGLAPLVQFSTQQWPLETPVEEGALTTAAWLTLTIMVSFDLGYAARRNIIGTVSPPKRVLSTKRLIPLGAFAVAVSIYEVLKVGGPGMLLTSRDTLSEAFVAAAPGALSAVHFALLGIPAFIMAYLLIISRRQKMIRGKLLTTLGFVAATLVLVNPITASRYLLGTVVIGMVLALLVPLTRTAFSTLMLIAGALFVFAFRVFNEFRFDTRVNEGGVSLDLSQLVEGDYDAFQQLANIVTYTHAHGGDPLQIVGPFLFFVPRSVWPGKPLDTGVVIGESFDLDFVNLSAPLPGELYIALGFPAVILGGLALGWVWAWLDQHLEINGPVGLLGLLTPILAVYQLILLRGSLLQAMGLLAVIAVLLLAATKPVAPRRRPRPEPRTSNMRRPGSRRGSASLARTAERST